MRKEVKSQSPPFPQIQPSQYPHFVQKQLIKESHKIVVADGVI